MTNFIFPRSHLAGLTLSTAGSSATFSVAAGQCTDSTNTVIANLAASISKTTLAWAAGTGNGALDTGSIAISTWYHVHLICDGLGQTVDILISLSATAPTLPSGYTLFRRIGSMLTDSSSKWLLFQQFKDDFFWGTAVVETGALANLTDTLFNLTVPTGVRVKPFLHVWVGNSTANSAAYARIRSPDLEATESPIGGFATQNVGVTVNVARGAMNFMPIITNLSGQISVISDSILTIFAVRTYGWNDDRGKLA